MHDCPAGTVGASENLADVTECSPCKGGYYCSSSGKSNFIFIVVPTQVDGGAA